MQPQQYYVTHMEAGLFQKSIFDVSPYRAQQSLWRHAVDGMEAVAKYMAETPTTTSEQIAVAVAKQPC